MKDAECPLLFTRAPNFFRFFVFVAYFRRYGGLGMLCACRARTSVEEIIQRYRQLWEYAVS